MGELAGQLQEIGGLQFGGVMRGVVVSNEDPGPPPRGRCKVWLFHIHGELPDQPDPDILPFAENALPFGGLENTGLVIIPEVGASVYCGFELGFIERPVMLGFWYGEEGLPDQHPTDETRDKKITLQRTDESGNRFLLQIDFVTNSIKVTRTTEDGDDIVQLNEDGIKSELNDGSGIEIERSTGNVVVNAQGNAEINAQGNAEVNAQGNADVKAVGDVTLAGGGIEATGKVVTTEHIDPFTGAPHPQGSVNVKASF